MPFDPRSRNPAPWVEGTYACPQLPCSSCVGGPRCHLRGGTFTGALAARRPPLSAAVREHGSPARDPGWAGASLPPPCAPLPQHRGASWSCGVICVCSARGAAPDEGKGRKPAAPAGEPRPGPDPAARCAHSDACGGRCSPDATAPAGLAPGRLPAWPPQPRGRLSGLDLPECPLLNGPSARLEVTETLSRVTGPTCHFHTNSLPESSL